MLDLVTLVIAATNIQITEEKIGKLLLDLDPNKALWPDGLHPLMLKLLAPVIKKPIKIIFDASLESGIVPDLWKKGIVKAIYKKGAKSDPGNYRPISLTSILCKVMEKIIRERIVEHLNLNNLLSDMQFGFLPGRSTTIQLIKVMDDWTKLMDNGGKIDAIYMDFMKARSTKSRINA